MLDWALSAICMVLLVLIVHRLLAAINAFHILQGDLVGREITEPAMETKAVPQTSSSPPSNFTVMNSDHLPLAPTITTIIPDYADDCCYPDDSKPLYIASIQGTRFHRQECSSVKRIREDNRQGFSHRDEAIESGYEPCSICNP